MPRSPVKELRQRARAIGLYELNLFEQAIKGEEPDPDRTRQERTAHCDRLANASGAVIRSGLALGISLPELERRVRAIELACERLQLWQSVPGCSDDAPTELATGTELPADLARAQLRQRLERLRVPRDLWQQFTQHTDLDAMPADQIVRLRDWLAIREAQCDYVTSCERDLDRALAELTYLERVIHGLPLNRSPLDGPRPASIDQPALASRAESSGPQDGSGTSGTDDRYRQEATPARARTSNNSMPSAARKSGPRSPTGGQNEPLPQPPHPVSIEAVSPAVMEKLKGLALRGSLVPAATDPTIESLGNRVYRLDKGDAVVVDHNEDLVLRAFLKSAALDHMRLVDQSGVVNAQKILGNLTKKYEGRFAAAIRLPKRKGRGGYFVRIRVAEAAASPS
jgi:hypothetical protein